MSPAETVLGILLVVAVVAVVYLLATRKPLTVLPEQPSSDLRIEAALNSLPGIQQDLGSLKTSVQGLPSNDIVQGIQQRLTNLETIQQDLGALKASVQSLPSNDVLAEIQNRLATLEVRVPNTLSIDLSNIESKLTTIVSDPKVGAVHDATQRLLALLAGGRGRGSAGEFVVGEALKLLPPAMLEPDFKVGGKTVEFALILPNSKRLPIDSKWAAADLLERLDKETDLEAQQRLIAEIERAVLAKAAEVAKYRNPAVTTDIGIAAIPDSAYRACRKAHSLAYDEYSVLVVPYSMVAPYVLALYNLYLKYGQAIELSNLQEYLNVIDLEVKNIDADLEGRVKEAGTRANNAYDSMKNALARIRAAAEFLKTAPQRISTSVETDSDNSNSGHGSRP